MIDQERGPSTTFPSSQSLSTVKQAPGPPGMRLPRRFMYLIVAGIVLGVLTVVYRTVFPSIADSEIRRGDRVTAIQLDVLNAAGESKLAQRVTDFLREQGFDVVEIGNYRDREVDKTLVIDRVGNRQAALRVAEALGIEEQQVVQQVDKTLYLDASVVIGKDFKTLHPFR